MTDDDKVLVERLRSRVSNTEIFLVHPPRPAPDRDCHYAADRIEALSAENERLIKAGDGDVGLIHWQGERIEQLEAALREVFEEWAGSEGFIPETAPEGYLLQLTKRMADIARAALGDTK